VFIPITVILIIKHSKTGSQIPYASTFKNSKSNVMCINSAIITERVYILPVAKPKMMWSGLALNM
jgi:hypothetical protein